MKNVVRLLRSLLALSLVLPWPSWAEGRSQQQDPRHAPAWQPQRKLSAAFDGHFQGAIIRTSHMPTVRVVVRPDAFGSESALRSQIAALGGRCNQNFTSFRLLTAEVPLARVPDLASDRNVGWISPDNEVHSTGLIETTTGAALVRELASNGQLDGVGVGIAVLDSGIDSRHKAFGQGGKNNVVFDKDFTGEARSDSDIYGHGTYVASLIGATEDFDGGAYTGISPGANLLNLRVLDGEGRGKVSSVLAALDWCVANKSAYNIRVINLSLGTTAFESYATDPLCLAARRAVNAGIVVIAAAGNVGKRADGTKLYGGIESPGIDPSVITVGAANTFGTAGRTDDVVTTYSSRGPTRGYRVVNGVKRYDNLSKPDLVAPGNKVIAAQSQGPDGPLPNRLVQLHPELDTGATNNKTQKTMYLSGTSVAAPIVAGAAALVLQANPTLTPNLVKAILMYSAQPIKGANTLEQGAGLLNVDGAVRLARLIKSNAATLANGSPMLSAPLPTPQASRIANQTCYWSQAVITDFGFLYGSKLMERWQGMYAQGIVLADATAFINGQFRTDPALVSSGVAFANGVILADGIVLADGVILADGIVLADGTALAAGIVLADGVILADGIVLADETTEADKWAHGDDTAAMQPNVRR